MDVMEMSLPFVEKLCSLSKRTLGIYEPHDAMVCSARMCSTVALLANHENASSHLSPRLYQEFAVYCCRVLAIYNDQHTGLPPPSVESVAALNALQTFASRVAPSTVAASFTRVAVASLSRDCFSGGAAAAIGEVVRNALVGAENVAQAFALGLF